MISKMLPHYPTPVIAVVMLVLFFILFGVITFQSYRPKNKKKFEELSQKPLN